MRQLNVKEKDLFDRVSRNPELQLFFFRRLKGLHWFDPLSQKGFFDPKNNPKPQINTEDGSVSVPYWPVTEYLVNTSIELTAQGNEEYAKKFLNVLKEVTHYAKAQKYSNYRTWWQFSKVINNIPLYLVGTEDIKLFDYWLDDPYDRGLVYEQLGGIWLPRILENPSPSYNQISQSLLESLYQTKILPQKVGEYQDVKVTFRADSWDVQQVTEKVARLAGAKLGLSSVELFQRKLIEIFDKLDNDKFSFIWRQAIEQHPQNLNREDAIDVLIDAYRDSLLGFIDDDPKGATQYVSSIFKNHYQTLTRVAIFAVNDRFAALKGLTDLVLVAGHLKSPFQHELWHFIHNRYTDFPPAQKETILQLTEGLQVRGDNEAIEEAPTAYRRSIWLSAFKDYDAKAMELYRKYVAVTKEEPEQPDFSSPTSVGWAKPRSPIPVGQLLTLDIKSLVATVNTYKPPDHDIEFSREGLLNSFKEVVKTRADEFYSEFSEFITPDLALVYPILESYRELWGKNKELPWDDIWSNLLDFSKLVISAQRYWLEDKTPEDSSITANKRQIICEIGQLIEEGTRSDDHAFDRKLLPKARDILLIILEHQKGQEIQEGDDAVTVAINSPRGHCIEALINLTLRACRLADKDSGNHTQVWSQFKTIYDTELQRGEEYKYEFITLVSMYILNLLYISPEWIRANLSNIFVQSDYQKWLCAMQGYSYVNVLNREVYTYLKTNGDLLKALDDKNIRDRLREKLIQNIIVAFLQGLEDIGEPQSMVSILLNRRRYTEIQQIVWFLWTLREENIPALKEKVFELWPRFLEIADTKSKEGRKLLSQLCHWAVFIDKIDATTENWLTRIAPYADEDFNSPYLLESLALISTSQPIEVQKIWLAMINSSIRDYPPSAIRKILEDLLRLKPHGERLAKEVVDAYLRQGIERPSLFLKEIKESVGQG
jgi:hypothetical protein